MTRKKRDPFKEWKKWDGFNIIKGWEFISQPDACPQCGPLDGTTYEIDKGPIPPLHDGCRCSCQPVGKSWEELGLPKTMSDANKAWLNGKPAKRETWSERRRRLETKKPRWE